MTIDWWTLAIQAVNVLLLVWLLGHFFWKPAAAMIERRRLAVQQQLDAAVAEQKRVAAERAEIERTRAGFAGERETILAQAQAEAESARRARLADAEHEAAAVAASAERALQSEREASERAWRDRAAQLALDIAGRLCAPLGGPVVQALFLQLLLDKIGALPEADRRSLAAAPVPLQVQSALALGPADEARVRDALAAVAGVAPPLLFDIEPELIAGVELRSAHLLISNSWRADAQRLRQELVHEVAR